MSRLTRCLAGVVGAVAVIMGGLTSPALADGTLQQCMNNTNSLGEPPECTQVNGKWVPSWPDSGLSSGGPGGGFVALFVLAALIGVGVLIWKIVTAQKLAKRSGMDPGMATTMTLLSDDGLSATYLAANLRQPPTTPTSSSTSSSNPAISGPSASTTAAERLTALTNLRDQNLITQDEYDTRRKAIIDAL